LLHVSVYKNNNSKKGARYKLSQLIKFQVLGYNQMFERIGKTVKFCYVPNAVMRIALLNTTDANWEGGKTSRDRVRRPA